MTLHALLGLLALLLAHELSESRSSVSGLNTSNVRYLGAARRAPCTLRKPCTPARRMISMFSPMMREDTWLLTPAGLGPLIFPLPLPLPLPPPPTFPLPLPLPPLLAPLVSARNWKVEESTRPCIGDGDGGCAEPAANAATRSRAPGAAGSRCMAPAPLLVTTSGQGARHCSRVARTAPSLLPPLSGQMTGVCSGG